MRKERIIALVINCSDLVLNFLVIAAAKFFEQDNKNSVVYK
jgi:hypothetical protein